MAGGCGRRQRHQQAVGGQVTLVIIIKVGTRIRSQAVQVIST
jgi:hypothetical protein